MRLLTQAKIPFRTAQYAYDESDLSGIHAAQAIGMPPEQVFKTLVTRSDKGEIAVFCIPVCCELSLKKAAKIVGCKKIEMVHVKELLALTGYIRGGCSPIGMKKKYPTFLDKTATLYQEIAVSAGLRGQQILLSPQDLAVYCQSTFVDIT